MPNNCALCSCKTTGVATFRATQKRLASWGDILQKDLKIGDRLCQIHFDRENLKKIESTSLKPKCIKNVSVIERLTNL